MLQLSGRSSTDCENDVASCTPDRSTNFIQPLGESSGPVHHHPTQNQQVTTSFPHEHGAGVMVHWKAAFPQQKLHSPVKESAQQSEDDDDEHCPFTPPPPRERLSYTRHQLELLNGIYHAVRYPNSTQKQLIAKRVGITREQVKIWFQNRRRKDVVTKTGKIKSASSDDSILSSAGSITTISHVSNGEICNEGTEMQKEGSSRCDNSRDGAFSQCQGISNVDSDNTRCNGSINKDSSCVDSSNLLETALSKTALPTTSTSSTPSNNLVSPTILRGMIAELNRFDNEYLKLKKSKKKKKGKSKLTKHATPTSSTLAPCKSERLFQNYDMVAPPNKVTPTAFLNISANKFKHAVGTSAFQSLRENRLPTINDSSLWDGFSVNPSTPAVLDTADFLQQRSSSDVLHPQFRSTLNFPPTHQPQYSSFLSARDGVSVPHSSLPGPQPPVCDNLPVLSDLLANYKSHHSSATAIAAAAAVAAAQRQQEHSLLSSVSSSQVHPSTNMPGVYFNLPVGSSASSTMNSDSESTLMNDTFSRTTSLNLFHQPQSSSLGVSRVYPFSLVAEPPIMLSSNRQSETLLHHPQWPHSNSSISSQTSLKSSALESHSNPNATPVSLSEDHYRPLVISSVSNPYFSQSSSTYPLPSSALPSQPHLWSI